MATNDFLPFSTSGTANVYTNAQYVADPDQANGNQPGLAKSKLVNKALRQCSIISTVVAQYIADITGNNAVDDGTTTTLLADLKNAVSANNTIGTIAALRLTPYTGQQIIYVTGYYTAADNIGVREYYWDAASTEADNGGTIIQVTGVVTGRWKMKYSGAVNVKWFGAKGDGVQDDTSIINTVIPITTSNGEVLYFPASTYKITSSIQVYAYTQILGDYLSAGTGYGERATLLSIISFEPSTPLPLFVTSGAGQTGGYRVNMSIEGLSIRGNSLSSSGNSTIAIDVDTLLNSEFKHISIKGFVNGIRCYATINNLFQNVGIRNCYTACVSYEGGTATTDVWEQCYLHYAPAGVLTTGISKGIRFNDCIFEGLDNVGVDLCKETQTWTFNNCYGEHVPAIDGASKAMFKVGYNGTTLSTSNALSVIGGTYSGNNAGTLLASFIDVDYTYGVQISNVYSARFYATVETTVNTKSGAISVHGNQYAQQTLQFTDTTKIFGSFANGPVNATTSSQIAKYGSIETSSLNILPNSAYIHETIVTLSGTGTVITIPITSQGSLNCKSIIEIIGIDGTYNTQIPKAFTARFAFGHLTSVSNLTMLQSSGTYSSVASSGLNINITLSATLATPILYIVVRRPQTTVGLPLVLDTSLITIA